MQSLIVPEIEISWSIDISIFLLSHLTVGDSEYHDTE